MTVEVTPLNVLGGVSSGIAPVLFFTDNFLRAIGPLGPNWISGTWGAPVPITQPLGGPIAQINNGSSTVAFDWGFNGTTGPGSDWIGMAFPSPTYVSLYGKTQFCEMVFDQAIAIQQSGPAVCLFGDRANAYFLDYDGSASVRLFAMLAAGGTPYQATFGLLATPIAHALAHGDILRLSADQSNPAQITLITTYNGTVVNTTVDLNTLPHGMGSPGTVAIGTSATGHMTWTRFTCGIGL